jgi:hypothetical protein
MNTLKSVLALLGVATLVGCQTAQPPSTPTTISCNVPAITAIDGTPERQEKGGVEVSIVPVLYKAVRTNSVVIQQENPPMASVLVVGNPQDKVYVRQTVTPRLEVEPSRLQFAVRVNNKLSRVFRGQGAVVQVNVAGKMIPFGNLDYAEFINGIVPPRNEAEFNIYALPVKDIPEKGTINISLYDVVTATDAAGNVSEKQNFEWNFSYTTKPVSETATTETQFGYIAVQDYQKYVLQQNRR